MSDIKEFLDKSPTPFHAAAVIASQLEESGYQKLDERDSWDLKPGKAYYLVRDERSVISFITGKSPGAQTGLRIAAAHLDSPVWKVKTDAAKLEKGICRYPVEPYGSIINNTWLDRDLEAAGMVVFKDATGSLVSSAWRSYQPVAIIPSLAIHLNRDVNKGVELNTQNHMAALFPAETDRSDDESDPLKALICRDLEIHPSHLMSSEIYLIPAQKAVYLGDGDKRLILSGRLDNLAMAHAILESLPPADENGDIGILAAWFDSEEVGSKTLSGASSLFLDEIIERIVLSAGGGREELMRARRASFMVSADMAHAVHPNYPDKHDPAYAPTMGGGPVLKSHGQKHYATDVYSEGRLALIAEKAGIPLQKLIFRSDLPSGYSLGPLASSAVSISTVDIGSPLWGMHSARETASVSDHQDMVELLRECWKI
jgi:aspartyl aminopeptidase